MKKIKKNFTIFNVLLFLTCHDILTFHSNPIQDMINFFIPIFYFNISSCCIGNQFSDLFKFKLIMGWNGFPRNNFCPFFFCLLVDWKEFWLWSCKCNGLVTRFSNFFLDWEKCKNLTFGSPNFERFLIWNNFYWNCMVFSIDFQITPDLKLY